LITKPDSCQGCPLSCHPYGSLQGFVPPAGECNKGVLMVGEAASQEDEASGQQFVGKAGHYLWGNLKRVGLERSDFRIANVISCRPPNNRLVRQPYEMAAIERCRPNLDAAIAEVRPKVILTLGQTAFKRVLGLSDYVHATLLKLDYWCYPFWSDTYSAWVIASPHPYDVMKGQHHLVGLLQFAALRAVEIAKDGFAYAETHYLEDPDPLTFRSWVDGYFAALVADSATVLSYDIETPMKAKEGNEEVVSKEEDNDYTILRHGFCYQPGHAVSIRDSVEYAVDVRRLFASTGAKTGWNSRGYDDPRIMAQMPIHGDRHDGMLAWHVLNSALPKGLGFVTPFYVKNTAMWKHLAEAKPAYYNAKDADMQLQNWLGIKRDLANGQLGGVFDNHVTRMNRVFDYMSEQGVPRDEALRTEAEGKLVAILTGLQAQMEEVVPPEAKNWKMRVATRCPKCGTQDVKAAHYKSIGKKRLKAGEIEQPCAGLKSVKEKVAVHAEPFKLSTPSLKRYQDVQKHKPIIDHKVKDRVKVTFDDNAIQRLRKKYPKDTLYPLIGEFRKHQKLLSTYIGRTQPDGSVKGGLQIGKDGLIHPNFTHNPSTLRSACQNPNLQNLPRPKTLPNGEPDMSDPATWIRCLVAARPGHTFGARDYSGIEAVLVGYFARDPGYIRLAKHDVHSFYTAYALSELDGTVHPNDLPLLSWDDERLFTRLAEIKKEFKEQRNSLYKHLVHGANFMQGARGAAEKIYSETGVEQPLKLVQRVMDIYFELFPRIRQWHVATLEQADHDGYLRNPFGYIHRFYRVYEWDKVGDQWQKEPGPDANKVIAFGPQSTAAGIIKEAMMRMYFDRFEEAGRYLRLLIHDEIFLEVPIDRVAAVDAVMREEMERPIQCMPMLPEWNMGEHLTVLTEAKEGERWGQMK
jgi:uracil-DNA glycosylase family 4